MADLGSIIKHAKRLISDLDADEESQRPAITQARQLIKDYAGDRSHFYATVCHGSDDETAPIAARAALVAFVKYVEADLFGGSTLRRRAEADVASSMLEQAAAIADDGDFHPAAATMLAGAVLEQFLRSWVEELALPIDGAKRTIEIYANALAKPGAIDRTDRKRVIAWGGQRNDAAHGEFDKVTDRQQARNMIEGIDLFMQRHAR